MSIEERSKPKEQMDQTEYSRVKPQTFLSNWMRSRTSEGWVICLKRNTVAGSHKRYYGELCHRQQRVLSKTDVHGSVHRNINLIERINKMQPCSRIYYSNVS